MSLTPEQIAVRRTRIGSSDIAVLLGIDPHRTVLDLFADKTLGVDREPTPEQAWGSAVERAILEHHGRTAGLTLIPTGTLIHPKHDHVCATPDALGLTSPTSGRVIEAKNVGFYNSRTWGDEETDDAPLNFVAQTTWEIGVAKAALAGSIEVQDTADLVAAISGTPPRVYQIQFDPELFGLLVEKAAQFKRDHIDTGKPPEGWAGLPGADDYLRRKFPAHDAGLIPATEEDLAHLSIIRTMSATAEAAQLEVDAAKNALRARIGEHAGIAGVATWKKCKDTIEAVTDWAEVCREASVPPAIVAKHTHPRVVRLGSRRLVLAKEK